MGAPDPEQRSPEEAHNMEDIHDITGPITPTETMTDNEQQIYAPPPHLAARFYRNRANARRKSSAASSRRNSLSSAHSRASSVSHRRGSGYQSNYIAQHLRRASIIESRKARLADRAAHAEQVRLRAALAKAAPRGDVSASEERALAAQLAKEKYLAKVAAACAEEVARAKRIAEEVKERKLAEEARVRAEMEERHAEAERRRGEYQRNLQARRARRADSAEKKLAVVEEVGDIEEEAVVDEEASSTLNEAAAACAIQRAWRLSRRRGVICAFVKLGLQQANSTFDDMTALIARPDVIRTTTAFLTQLGLQHANDENASLNTRTFLSAYLMLAHPTAVLLNRNGAQEQDLLPKATELLANTDNTLARLAAWNNYSPSATQLEALSQSYSAYTSAFAAWRLQDSSVLIEGMVASFVELDAIWQTVKDDDRGEVASDYREGIRDNQVLLLSRIRKLAGADRADQLIKKAIRESRRKRPKKRNAAEVRPRGVEVPSVQASAEPAATLVEPTPATEAEEWQSQSSAEITRKLFTPMPSNRVLTHELAIDKDYKLTDTSAALREDLYRSICASMKQCFEAGEGSLWTLSAAENVREKLLRMLKPGNSMYTLISETLDLESIARQCQAGIFSYDGFFDFMANVLPKLCAPFRDQEIAALVGGLKQQPTAEGGELDAMIDKLFKLLRAVDTLSLDYTNFMLMSMAPTLVREAAGYEQRAFAADLEAGRITLQRTKRWWRDAQGHLSTEADGRDPGGVRLAADRPKPEKVYARVLVDLAIEQGPLTMDAVPETLHLDVARLAEIRAQAVRVTVIGAVLLTAKNLLKRDVRAQWKAQASRLWQLLSIEAYGSSSTTPPDASSSEEPTTTAQKAFSILETASNIPPSTKQQLNGTITRFFSQAAATSEGVGIRFTDPVLKVLFQRLRTHVLGRLSASTSVERVRAASSASEMLTSCGLGEMTGQISGMVEVLEGVRRVDWEGHGGWYEGIVGEVEVEGGRV
ncbi:hypothetical protein BAUCODRAFT_33402 [Baudoinia panamericana UAMH 10762]|uniref:Uncharacterized protein n=1 Tax=Baudoinia panamericana (strain UAMH 10762) TaxID=717646 RepID=M2NEK9_BAUPA|nr:uncharacterized protein BAUCODRAFT_33402 [Baudoinia panamericana UAMH 10762]EMC97679.1 hypothetical protein BAUCODRAFT_33402 [Baudoinia panamericana UAMH 10762]